MAFSLSHNIVAVSLPAGLPVPLERDKVFDHRAQPSSAEDALVLLGCRDHNSAHKALQYKDLPKETYVF
jgi:hypothetical protein